jgi:TatD DNase family protein
VFSLIDSHAHLDDEQFAGDRPAILQRALAAGVVNVISIATTAASTAASLALAKEYPALFATAGIHPNNAAGAGPDDWDRVIALATDPRVVGIGETGLDRHWHDTPFPLQEEYFARHLELSRRTGKPVIIHCREAEADVLRMLREAFERHGPVHGVMHSFTGDAEMAQACRDMGLFLSFAGMLTYKNAVNVRETAAKQPADRLVVETDSPYLAPVPVRGKRNEPAHVVHTATCLANVLNLSLDVLANRTTANARALFGLQ